MPPHARTLTASTTTATGTTNTRWNRALIGSHVRTSVAAERALEAGEDTEDALWLGSGRLDGSLVRCRLLHRRSSSSRHGHGHKPRRRLLMGSQRLLQGMRFWESIRLAPTNTSSAALAATTTTAVVATPPSQQQQESNRSRLCSDASSRKNMFMTPLREQQLRVSKQLLSMRCEASRSIRRQRGAAAFMHWMQTNSTEDDNHNHEPTSAATALQDKQRGPFLLGRAIPFLRSTPQTTTTTSAKHKQGLKKKRQPKKWRLWLPYAREPMELVHPALSVGMESNASSSSSCIMQPLEPAHVVLLKQQQLAQSQTTSLPVGSNHVVAVYDADADAAEPLDLEEEDVDTSLVDDPNGSNRSVRSTRNDVRSNETLLVRRPRSKGLSTTTNPMLLSGNDAGHLIESKPQPPSNRPFVSASDHGPRKRSSFLTVRMPLPNTTTGSILVQPIYPSPSDVLLSSKSPSEDPLTAKALSVDASIDTLAEGILYNSNHSHVSNNSKTKNKRSSYTYKKPFYRNDSDDNFHGSTTFYTVQELLDSAVQIKEPPKISRHDDDNVVDPWHVEKDDCKEEEEDEDSHDEYQNNKSRSSYLPARMHPSRGELPLPSPPPKSSISSQKPPIELKKQARVTKLECLDEPDEKEKAVDQVVDSLQVGGSSHHRRNQQEQQRNQRFNVRGIAPTLLKGSLTKRLTESLKVSKAGNQAKPLAIGSSGLATSSLHLIPTGSTKGNASTYTSSGLVTSSLHVIPSGSIKGKETSYTSDPDGDDKDDSDSERQKDKKMKGNLSSNSLDRLLKKNSNHKKSDLRQRILLNLPGDSGHRKRQNRKNRGEQAKYKARRARDGDAFHEILEDSLASMDLSSLELDQMPCSNNGNSRHYHSLSALERDSGNQQAQLQPQNTHYSASLSSLDDIDNNNTGRKSLPPTVGLGPRQHGIRGGILTACAMEAIHEATLLEQEEEAAAAAVQVSQKPPRAPPLYRRTRTAPEPRQDHAMEGHEVTLEHGVKMTGTPARRNKLSRHYQRLDPSIAPTAASGVEMVWKGKSAGTTSKIKDASAVVGPICQPLPTSPSKDWWNAKGEGVEALHGLSPPFGSNVFIIWDEDTKKEPLIVMSDDPLDPLMNSTNHEYQDARSVASEPAEMGMLEDSIHTSDDLEHDLQTKRWNMAWDDLALL